MPPGLDPEIPGDDKEKPGVRKEILYKNLMVWTVN